MKLNELDIEKLRLGDREHIDAACEILSLIKSRPDLELYASICSAIRKISKDLENASVGAIFSDDKESKSFERLNMIIKSYPEYQQAVQAGNRELIGEQEEDKGTTRFGKRRGDNK
jgi:hypothetical protein